MSRIFDTDKRRYIRYEVLDYSLVEINGVVDATNAIIVDIGLGGLQLRTKSAIDIGKSVKIQVGRVDQPALILKGEVRHCSLIPQSDLFGIGVRFMPDTHDERMAIAEYVHSIFQRQCDLLST